MNLSGNNRWVQGQVFPHNETKDQAGEGIRNNGEAGNRRSSLSRCFQVWAARGVGDLGDQYPRRSGTGVKIKARTQGDRLQPFMLGARLAGKPGYHFPFRLWDTEHSLTVWIESSKERYNVTMAG